MDLVLLCYKDGYGIIACIIKNNPVKNKHIKAKIKPDTVNIAKYTAIKNKIQAANKENDFI